MAESYRGLTIRIGGDTTKLSAALKSANQAISGTQSELRKLSQALKLDPTSLKASQLQMGAMAEQASNVSSRLVTLRQALKQVGDSMPGNATKTVKEMADGWEDVQANAARANSTYNTMTKALAESYTQLSKVHKEAAKVAGINLSEKLSGSITSMNFDNAIRGMTELRSAFGDKDGKLKEMLKNLGKLKGTYAELSQEAEGYKKTMEANANSGEWVQTEINGVTGYAHKMNDAFTTASAGLQETSTKMDEVRTKFAGIIEELANYKGIGEVFKEKNGNVDLASIAKGLKEIVEQGKMTAEEADKVYDHIESMKNAWLDAEAELQKADTVAAFTDLEAEAARAEAQMQKFVDEIVKAGNVSSTAKGLGTLDKQMASVSTESNKAEQRLKAINAELKKHPGDKALQADRVKAYADAVGYAEEKVKLHQKRIAAYTDEKVIQLAHSNESLAESTMKAKTAVESAAKQWATFNGKLNEVRDRITDIKDKLKTTSDEGEKTKLLGDLSDEEAKLSHFEAMVDQLRQRLRSAQAERNVFVSANELREEEAAVDSLARSIDDLNKKGTGMVDQAAFMQSVQMVTQAVRRMGSEIVQASNEIDSAYRDMRKTVNGTEKEFENLRNAAIEYSQTHITSADTMLEMQALGGQLGIVVEDLEKFGTIASNLDISTDIGAEDIALQLGQMGNVMQLDIEGMQGFSDALVRLGNNMPAQESRIMNVAQRFAAVASTANFSGSEILAWSAAIASTGQRSEAAATAIGNTVSGIEQAIANGGADLKNFAAISRMSADEFAQAWKDDPTEALKEFIKGLQTLKDSDESAVAALENMGITGVRQQQTLLGLSQTIGTLDDALEMSRDAWNQVGDQWGQAGDAAIEAQKKSEGFSGQLAILKNNAQDLAAAFGDGLIPMMKAGATVLQFLTDIFNAMPAPAKAVVTTVGAIGAAMAVAAPIVTTFAKGYQEMMAVMGAGSITSIVSKLSSMAAELMGVETATAGAAAAVSGPFVLGVLAAVGVVATLASFIGDTIEKQRTFEEATTGLATATDALKTAYDEQASGMQDVGEQYTYLTSKTDELIEKQADLAEEMRNVWEEVGNKEAQVDAYANKIDELREKSKLTESEQRQLIAAVEEYNDLTGSTLTVLDAEKGILDDVTGKLSEHANAWKEHLESSTAMEQWNKAVLDQAENEKQLAVAQDKLAEAQEKFASSTTNVYTGANQARDEFKLYHDEVERLTALIEDNKRAQEKALALMSDSDQAMANLSVELQGVGDSMDNYTMLTEKDWAQVVQAYARSTDEAINLLRRLKREYSDASGIAGDLEASSKAAINKAVKAAKAENDAKYKELKRHLDDTYKARQRKYDAKYKQAQRASDRAYKLKQREYDAAYKAAQKAYDAQYKAAQKAYDAEYNAYKKSLDQRYNELKKQLDNEYKAKKKTYDAELKAFKKQQDDEVDAFKKATDAKLKAMEAEYKQKLKNLELEYGQKDSSLEDRIKQLNAETEAEKKAIEERNENDKVAELQRAVEQAKTRRTRAEAEKELNDYLQELEQKRNEESRQGEIDRIKEQQDALKEELEQRKEILKEEYDADVEAYKAKREMELEALQEANDVEYTARQEYYDLQLEQLKEANDTRLEAEKEANDALLEQMKEFQTSQLEALKESQTESLEALKQNQQDELEAYKQGQQDELDALKQSQQDKLAELKDSHQKQLDDLKAEQAAEIEEIKSGNSQKADEDKKAKDEAEKTAREHGEVYNNGIAAGYEKAIGTSKVSSERMIDNMEWAKRETENAGQETGEGYSNAIGRGLEHAVGTSKDISDQIENTLSNAVGENDGQDMMTNFVNGAIDYFNNSGYQGLWQIAEWIESIFRHSTPKRGPLKDDDKWFVHLGENLVDGLKSKEGELYKQVNKMARTIEEGFDPMLTVDAAYDAIDSINSSRAKSAAQAASYAGEKNTTIEVNVNLANVSIRSDEDIEKLATAVSQRMAAQVRRQQAGRL